MKKKILGILLSIIMLFSIISTNTYNSQAANTSISHKKMLAEVGNTKVIKLNDNKKNVVWTTSNKKVVSIVSKSRTRVKLKALKKGKATITAKIGDKKYYCKITVVKNTKYSLAKKFKGEATYYNYVSGGACGLDDFSKKYLTCALNIKDYNNNLAGAYLEVTDKDGDKVKVLVIDILPSGKKGDIDLSKKAFKKIEPPATGRMNISWKIIPLPTDEPIYYKFKPSSGKYWASLQVRNYRYPIKSLEYLDRNTNQYVALKRESWNYFTAPNGMGDGPFTFRVTSIYGQTLIDDNISINCDGTDIKGKANFPYIFK